MKKKDLWPFAMGPKGEEEGERYAKKEATPKKKKKIKELGKGD